MKRLDFLKKLGVGIGAALVGNLDAKEKAPAPKGPGESTLPLVIEGSAVPTFDTQSGRYMRMYTEVSGTSPSITYSAHIAPKKGVS